MLLSLGIDAASHHGNESLEHAVAVERPTVGFGVELERKGPLARVVEAFTGAVVDVDEAHHRPGIGQRGVVHGVAVILTGDIDPAGLEVLRRLVCAPVAELHLSCACAGGNGHHLVTQADAEGGQGVHEYLYLLYAVCVFGRVAGTVGKHDAVVSRGDYLLRRSLGRVERYGAAACREAVGNAALVAEVQQSYGIARFAPRRKQHRLLYRDLIHDAGDPVRAHELEQCVVRLSVGHGGVHDALGADELGNAARVHAADAADPLLAKEGVHIHLGAEVRGAGAVFPHHDAACVDVRTLTVLIANAVVAEHGEGEGDELATVARVREALGTAGHARGEHKLAHARSRRAEALSFKHHAVFKQQIGL